MSKDSDNAFQVPKKPAVPNKPDADSSRPDWVHSVPVKEAAKKAPHRDAKREG